MFLSIIDTRIITFFHQSTDFIDTLYRPLYRVLSAL